MDSRTMSNSGVQATPSEPGRFPAPVASGLTVGARRIVAISVCLVVVVAIAAYLYSGLAMASGVLGGGVLGLVNFWLLARIVVKTTGDEMSAGALAGRLFAKFAILGGVLGLLILFLRLDPVGLLLGLGVIFPAILLGSLMDLFVAPSDVCGVTR